MTSTPASASRSRHVEDRAAILFDLDGTLIDSIELILASMRHAFARRGNAPPADAEWLTGVGIPLHTMFRRYFPSDHDVEEMISYYREHQLANHDRLVVPYDDVVDTVQRLHALGHPLAVVTSKTEALARRGLSYVQLLPLFDEVIGCDSCSRHKPHPEPVLTALERLGRRGTAAYFVGDSVHDIEAGNAAGVETVAALWGPFTREELAPARPTHYLERICDLPALVEGRVPRAG